MAQARATTFETSAESAESAELAEVAIERSRDRSSLQPAAWAGTRNKHGDVDKRKLNTSARTVLLKWARHPYWNDPLPRRRRSGRGEGDGWSGPRAPRAFRVGKGNPRLVPTIESAFRSSHSKCKTDALILVEEDVRRRCRRLSRLKDYERFGATSREVDRIVGQVRYVFRIGYSLSKTGEWLTDGVREDEIPDLLRAVDTPTIHYGFRPWSQTIEADARDLGVTPDYLWSVARSITPEHIRIAYDLVIHEEVPWREIPGRLGLPQLANLYLHASVGAVRWAQIARTRATSGKNGSRPREPASRLLFGNPVVDGKLAKPTGKSVRKFGDMAAFLDEVAAKSRKRAIQLSERPYLFLAEYQRFAALPKKKRAGITLVKRFLKDGRSTVLGV